MVVATTLGAGSDSRSKAQRADFPTGTMLAAAAGEWSALQDAVASTLAAGAVLPCRTAPEVWWGMDHDQAVAGCSVCPVVEVCRAYAVAAGERFGVWGGLTPAERQELAAEAAS